MTKPNIVYVDTETTGTNWYHELWEVGVVLATHEGEVIETYQSMVKPTDLTHADTFSLSVGGYTERYAGIDVAPFAADKVWRMLSGNVLAGITVSFDARMVGEWFKRNGMPPFPWHYRLLDVSTYAAGIAAASGMIVPGHMPGSDEIFDLYAIEIPEEDRHTAMGDAMATHLLHKAAKAQADKIQRRLG